MTVCMLSASIEQGLWQSWSATQSAPQCACMLPREACHVDGRAGSATTAGASLQCFDTQYVSGALSGPELSLPLLSDRCWTTCGCCTTAEISGSACRSLCLYHACQMHMHLDAATLYAQWSGRQACTHLDVSNSPVPACSEHRPGRERARRAPGKQRRSAPGARRLARAPTHPWDRVPV